MVNNKCACGSEFISNSCSGCENYFKRLNDFYPSRKNEDYIDSLITRMRKQEIKKY